MKRILFGIVVVSLFFGVWTVAEAAGITEGFDDFQNGVRPAGWIFRNCNENSDAYTAAGYFGVASPSILLDSSQDDIFTTLLTGPTALTFWTRSLASNPSSNLFVQEYLDASWTQLTLIYNISSAAVTYGPLTVNPSSTMLRFKYGKDSVDMVIDDVVIAGAITPAVPTPSPLPAFAPTPAHLVIDNDDYDGDGYSDYALYRPSTGGWYIDGITEGVIWGGGTYDVPASGDYNGDGTGDIAYFNRQSGLWNVKDGIGPADITTGLAWGGYGDWPVPGDYDGNGTTDYAVWNVVDGIGTWKIFGITEIAWGETAKGDIPVPGDYDGDGAADIAVWRQSNNKWYVNGGAPVRTSWGVTGSIPVPLDSDGDGVTDFGIFWPRPTSTAIWFVKDIAKYTWGWGSQTDLPVIGNFIAPALDAEIGIFRTWASPAGQGAWFIYGGVPFSVTAEDGDIPAVGQSY
jgi:hypothetical protein